MTLHDIRLLIIKILIGIIILVVPLAIFFFGLKLIRHIF